MSNDKEAQETVSRCRCRMLGMYAGKSAQWHFFTCLIEKKARSIEHLRKENCRRSKKGKEPDLGSLVVYVVEDSLKCRIVETSLDSPSFILLESAA